MRAYYSDGKRTLYHGDAREVLPALSAESSMLVLTDPPYPGEFLPLYEDLGRESLRLLRNGGNLVSLCGTHQLPEVLDHFRAAGLRYWWTASMPHTSKLRLPGKWVCSCWKPAPWFVKKRRRTDFIECPMDSFAAKADKRFHEWGQPTAWFSHWIQRLTLPGELVIDPFSGGGAVLRAAKDLDREAVGVELSEESCEMAARRLEQGVFDFAE
jgi:hypothetical protein